MGPILCGRATINYAIANLNLIGDGNSFGYGVGASNWPLYLYAQMAAAAPINGRASFTNVSVNGQNIRSIIGRAPSQVDNRYISTVGVKNIYSVLEATNSICNTDTGASRTGLQAAADLAELCLGRKAIHPGLKIIAWTAIPRFSLISAWSTVQANAYIQEFNTYLRANYHTMGIDAIADPAALAQFTADPSATSVPSNMNPYMSDPTHPNDTGYGLLAACGNIALRRLSAR